MSAPEFDYSNTPSSAERPPYPYRISLPDERPHLSIITAYFNAGPEFLETLRSVQRQSLVGWEWIVVDDGSTDRASRAQLEAAAQTDPRVRVLHQPNNGPGAARNTAARAARGRYLLQIDADDLIEPTFAEQGVWFLETHPGAAFCNGWNIGFGDQHYTWQFGYERGAEFLEQNWVHMCAVIRREAFLDSGGYDETIRRGHEDWDLWLNLAAHGFWGYTLPEYLTWYRRRAGTRKDETDGKAGQAQAFKDFLREKHAGLAGHFPVYQRAADHSGEAPSVATSGLSNMLAKPDGARRFLLIADSNPHTPSTVTTVAGALHDQSDTHLSIIFSDFCDHATLRLYRAITPDVFCLPHFLEPADYPRFLAYFVVSRQIDQTLTFSRSPVGNPQPVMAPHSSPYLTDLEQTRSFRLYFKLIRAWWTLKARLRGSSGFLLSL